MTSITIYRGDSVRTENYHGQENAPTFGRFVAVVRQDRISTSRIADGTWAIYSPIGTLTGEYTEQDADEEARQMADSGHGGWTTERANALAAAIDDAKCSHNSRTSSPAYVNKYGAAVE